MATVGLPLTGAGDATAAVATDEIGGAHYQRMKLMDGLEGSTLAVLAKETTPGTTDAGLVVRNIPSSGLVQLMAGDVNLTSAGSTKVVGRVDVNNFSTATELGSGGSTKLVGQMTVANPTTAVSLSSGAVLGPSTAAIGQITSGAQTIGTVNLSSEGSTKITGTVNLTSGSILGGSTAAIGQLTSGTQTIGSVQLTSAGTTGSIGSVALLAGSSTNTLGNVTVSNLSTGGGGSTTVDANLSSAGSTKIVGTVNQGSPAGSSADAWWVRTVTTGTGAAGATTVDANLSSAGSTKIIGIAVDRPYTTDNIARTTANSSVDVSLLAANANRTAAIIANGSTGTALLVSFSTAAVSSAGAYTFQVPALGYVTLGGVGGFVPNYRGAIRGKMNSTAVAGPTYITEFTS